jgi:hypothetical protein
MPITAAGKLPTKDFPGFPPKAKFPKKRGTAMRADEALRRSAEHLICFETADGLVTIYHEKPERQVSAEPFHLRFIPRDREGLLNSWGTVMVGSYDRLDEALRAAADKYVARENGWRPITAEDLPKGGHGPPPLEQ